MHKINVIKEFLKNVFLGMWNAVWPVLVLILIYTVFIVILVLLSWGLGMIFIPLLGISMSDPVSFPAISLLGMVLGAFLYLVVTMLIGLVYLIKNSLYFIVKTWRLSSKKVANNYE